MTTATASLPIDVTGAKPIPFHRLLKVELRKMGDTRAGLWMLIIGGAFAVLVTLGFFIWGKPEDREFMDLFGYAGIPFAMLLPVMGILTVTQEWGQRTALVTFTHVPKRSRVLMAKAASALLYGFAAFALAGIVALVLAPLGGADEPFRDADLEMIGRVLLGLEMGVIWGLAFGVLFLNTAFAIVLYFLVPTVVSIVYGIWEAAQEQILWVDLNQSMGHLFDSSPAPDAKIWGQIAVGSLLWIVLPGVLGVLRTLRSEIK